ncbi:SLAM family member 5-like isoform X4 [Rhinichthys klamathensis goyatoka]|uniref:SLAM family member 5-like isoform X4 n=1 Tax=Rhinichthys klamathensis goyatoka TaxID=3034132 RepID=UPI0024B526D9|nr:SLAM family member 5-like isoform X4 [Rhinichthys klamathensis goyatoka]
MMSDAAVFFLCVCVTTFSGVFSDTDEVKSVSVTEGDSVSLNTDVQVQRGDQILWTFGPQNTRIAEIFKRDQMNYVFVSNDGIFRDRLQMDNQTGSLTIRNIRSEHTGLYKLYVISSRKTLKRFNVTVYAPLPIPVISSHSLNCSSSSSSSSSSSLRSSESRCSLVCSVWNVSDVTLSWYAGISVLSSISVCDLSISLSLPLDVEYQDNNTYSCVINNPVRNQTTHLDITELCHTCEEQSHRSYFILIIISVCLLVFMSAVILIYCCSRTFSRAQQKGKYYQQLTKFAIWHNIIILIHILFI